MQTVLEGMEGRSVVLYTRTCAIRSARRQRNLEPPSQRTVNVGVTCMIRRLKGGSNGEIDQIGDQAFEQRRGDGGRRIDLEQPQVKSGVEHEIESKQLKTGHSRVGRRLHEL